MAPLTRETIGIGSRRHFCLALERGRPSGRRSYFSANRKEPFGYAEQSFQRQRNRAAQHQTSSSPSRDSPDDATPCTQQAEPCASARTNWWRHSLSLVRRRKVHSSEHVRGQSMSTQRAPGTSDPTLAPRSLSAKLDTIRAELQYTPGTAARCAQADEQKIPIAFESFSAQRASAPAPQAADRLVCITLF